MNPIGVWKSTDHRENRCIYVTRSDDLYVYGYRCDPRGYSLPGEREVRVRLNSSGDGPARYRRLKPEEKKR